MATIRERIETLTQEYSKIYETLKVDPVLGDSAANIALSDPVLKKYTWEKVEKNVRKHIDLDVDPVARA